MNRKNLIRLIVGTALAVLTSAALCACYGSGGSAGTGTADTVNSNDGIADGGVGSLDNDQNMTGDSVIGDMVDDAGNAVRSVGKAAGNAVSGAGNAIGDLFDGTDAGDAQRNGVNAKPGGGNTTANR